MAIVSYRAVASDGSLHGELFETDDAERFKGAFCPFPDGSSGTSKEDLYLTDDGVWIKNSVVFDGRSATPKTSLFHSVSKPEARDWLKRHDQAEAASRLLP